MFYVNTASCEHALHMGAAARYNLGARVRSVFGSYAHDAAYGATMALYPSFPTADPWIRGDSANN